MDPIVIVILMVLLLVVFFVTVALFPFGVYIKCLSAGVPAGPFQLVGMGLRKVPLELIVENFIKGTKAGLDISLDKLEVHYLSSGDVVRVINALISASRANLRLNFDQAAAIDLAGRDVLEAVQMQVQPRVISTGGIAAVAKNGIEVVGRAKITLRANLHTMVGGAGEETILARVCEGIVSAIGSCEVHTEVLARPEMITEKIMKSSLDAGTAFEIISLDIFDIDVGRNIGAILQNDQAQADQKVAAAKAEGRRAMAIAQTQENRAMEQEAKAKLVEAEMRVPHALADSFRAGKLLVKRKNQESPTDAPDISPPAATAASLKSGLGFSSDTDD